MPGSPFARRAKHAHWTIDPAAAAAAGLDIVSVPKSQQWETPWEVFAYVLSRWTVEFDACASPLSALAPRYASAADDFLARDDLDGITIFCNPPYSLDRSATGSCGAIEPIVRKLVEGDVSDRGCTAIALLPVLAHQPWFHRYVTGAASGGRACHELVWISGLLKWNNPFHEKPPASPYIYPFVLCVWHPGVPPDAPKQSFEVLGALPPSHPSRSLQLRRCRHRGCGKVRVLPRYVDAKHVSARKFECSQAGDERYASCEASEYVLHFT